MLYARHLPNTAFHWTFVALALVAGVAAADQPAGQDAPLRLETRLAIATPPSLASPMSVGHKLRAPLWTDQGLWRTVPASLPGLDKVQPAGTPTYDRSTNAWYASAQGSLVRIEGDGRLTVVADNIQGRDVDVRAALKLAVSREPNDTIVLHDWNSNPIRRTVLISGAGYFGPKFSPDGSSILLRESRAGGGHMWTVSLNATGTDLGRGNDPSWHPDGRHVVFDRTTHDGMTLTSSDLWVMDTQTRTERLLAHTTGLAEIQPTVSPDGRWVAFADAFSADGYVAELNLNARRR